MHILSTVVLLLSDNQHCQFLEYKCPSVGHCGIKKTDIIIFCQRNIKEGFWRQSSARKELHNFSHIETSNVIF